jgi:hypothetical protein
MTLNEDDKEAILRDILSTGFSSEENKRINVIIANKIHNYNIVQISSGSPKIRHNVKGRFSLILSIPAILSGFNPFTIRCCLCNKVVAYPCWYYNVKFTSNHFHYFVCFNSGEINASCYKR